MRKGENIILGINEEDEENEGDEMKEKS